jgi:hypothetical protein
LPQYDSYFRQVCAVGVRKEWQNWLDKLLFQLNLARVLAREEEIHFHNVVLISQFASLLKILKVGPEVSDHIKTYSQPFENKVLLYLWGPIFYNIGQATISLLRSLIPRKNKMPIAQRRKPVVGVTAAWGTGLEGPDKSLSDDFFWWRRTNIPPKRLICMFDRQSFQPTQNRLADLEKLGIQSMVLDPKYPGDIVSTEVTGQKLSLIDNFKKCSFYFKLAWRSMSGDGFTQSACSLIGWQIYKSEKLVSLYKGVNLRGVFHIHEPGLEFVNLAALQVNAARIGVHWSCLLAPNSSSPKCQEVFFVWGEHDLKIVLDSGSISKNILLSGCHMTEKSHKEEFQKGQEAVQLMKNRGVRFTLSLFDNSHPVPNFYRFFMQWLVDDPALGILIKSKGPGWKNIVKKGGLGGLVKQAVETERLYVMDSKATPEDAALLTDFSVGITSISAIAAAALKGARVLYLDFEKTDQSNMEPYSIFHSLGPDKCVFYDLESLKEAVLEYTNNPESNPALGDASTILDQLDPFRDGNASQRIGEYVSWYLEGLDQNLSKDFAIRAATDKYAHKWGKDKVIRGLDENP